MGPASQTTPGRKDKTLLLRGQVLGLGRGAGVLVLWDVFLNILVLVSSKSERGDKTPLPG